jgi:RNA polymerase sigma-70 factor (ECF subfamily)
MISTEFRDIQLMGRVAAGDQTAFADLFDRHSPVVLGVLIRMLRRRELAEEVLQEAFLQAWDQAGRYEPERATPRSWILMLARSRALDRLRSSQARGRREEAISAEHPWNVEVAPVGTEKLEATERSRQVAQALDGLPRDQRTCIELAFFGGLTHTQIAQRLEIPLGTIKSRIALGMRKLRNTMGPPS